MEPTATPKTWDYHQNPIDFALSIARELAEFLKANPETLIVLAGAYVQIRSAIERARSGCPGCDFPPVG